MMADDAESRSRGYRAGWATHGGYGMPRGPLGHIRDNPGPFPAIGFCPRCGENARRTCSNRGVFDCPRCTYFWFDDRVGKQTRHRQFEDYFHP